MSSISFGRFYYHQYFINNEKTFLAKIDNTLREIKNLINTEIKELSGIIHEIKSYFDYEKEDFKRKHTLDFFNSHNYDSWYNSKLKSVNEIGIKIKRLIKDLSLEGIIPNSKQNCQKLIKLLQEYQSDSLKFTKTIESLQSKMEKFELQERMNNINEKIKSLQIKINNPYIYEFLNLLSFAFKEVTQEFDPFSFDYNQKKDKKLKRELSNIENFLENFEQRITNFEKLPLDKKEMIYKLIQFFEKFGEPIYEYKVLQNFVNKLKNEKYGIEIEEQFALIKSQLTEKTIKINTQEIPEKSKEDELGIKVKNLKRKIKEKFPQFYDEIENKYSNIKDLKLLLDSLEFEFLKLKKQIVDDFIYRQEIENIKKELMEFFKSFSNFPEIGKPVFLEFKTNFEDIMKSIDHYLAKKNVEEKDYMLIKNNADEFIQKLERFLYHLEKKKKSQEFKNIIKEKLNAIGYSVIFVNDKDVSFLDTPFDFVYKIMLKIEDDIIKVQFVRILDDSETLTEYEKQKDIYYAERWCNDYKNLLNLLEKNGIVIKPENIIEPNQRMNYLYISELPEYLRKQAYEYFKSYQGKKTKSISEQQKFQEKIE